MSEVSEGATRGSGEFDSRWDRFGADLTDYLSTMVDVEERDHLIIELPDLAPEADGCPPYAQFAGFGEGGMLRAEVSADAYLRPEYHLDPVGRDYLIDMGWSSRAVDPDDSEPNWHVELPTENAAAIAGDVVAVLRTHFGIAHPQLLSVQAWGPAAAGVASLGLCATVDVPAEAAPSAPVPPVTLATTPDDRDELLGLVAEVLRTKFGAEPEVDEDGDFVLRHLREPIWVQVRADMPAIELVGRVVHDVRSRRAAHVELGLMNRDSVWVRWTLRDRVVWQQVAICGAPFAPAHLSVMIDVFTVAMTQNREDLALRLGARLG